MHSRLLGLLALVAGISSGLGCASHPLPLSAQIGSTIAIPISIQDNLAYGGEWYEASGLFDDQRGRLTFTFDDGTNPPQTADPLAVTRMFPDPATDAALDGKIDYTLLGSPLEFGLIGQTVALVTVPTGLTPGPHDILIGRKVRTAPGVWTTVTPAPLYNGAIEVLPATVGGFLGVPNDPPAGALNDQLGTIFEVDLTGSMVDVYPHPALEIAVPATAAAGHIVVNFPDTKATIVDFVDIKRVSRDGMLASSVTAPGVLEADFVFPGVGYVFAVLFDPSDPFGAGVPLIGDFSIDEASSQLYDEDGVQILDDGSGGTQAGSITITQIR